MIALLLTVLAASSDLAATPTGWQDRCQARLKQARQDVRKLHPYFADDDDDPEPDEPLPDLDPDLRKKILELT